jgi:uroporphyrinogen-III synthase
VTSGRAIQSLAEGTLVGRRVYCVGDRTAELAGAAGAATVLAAADAGELAAQIIADGPAHVIYFRGEHASVDLAGMLRAGGVETLEFRVYESIDRPLSPEALELLAGSATVLAPVFSARSATLLAQAVGEAAPRLVVAAISDKAAAPLAVARRIGVAASPDAEALASVVLSLWRDLP